MTIDYSTRIDNGQCVSVTSTVDVQLELESRYSEQGPYVDQIVVYEGGRGTYLLPSRGQGLGIVRRFLKSSLFTKEIGLAKYVQRGCIYLVRE